MNSSAFVGRDSFLHSARSHVYRAAGLAAAVVVLALTSACGGGTAQPTDAQRAGILLNAGLNAQREGRLSEAAGDYRRVLAVDPRNQWAHYNLGLIEQLAGENTAAESDYRAALVTDPNFVGALYNLAILRTNPAPQEAVDLYRHALSVTPNNAIAHLNLGFVLISLGQQAEGKAELQRAVVLDPALAPRIPAPSPAPAGNKKP